MGSILTLKMLKGAGACRDQVKLFEKLFGNEVYVTEEACIAVADKFNWNFAARHFLPTSAWAEYECATAPAWAEYDRVCATAWDDYERATAPAWAEYDRVCATAFGRLYDTGGK